MLNLILEEPGRGVKEERRLETSEEERVCGKLFQVVLTGSYMHANPLTFLH